MRIIVAMAICLLSFPVFSLRSEMKTFTLKNASGMEVKVINYGGIITSISVPNREGKFEDVVLGFDLPEDYEKNKDHPYFGALIGRYGNRIAKGRFSLEGKDYKLAVNNGPNALHGGLRGFDKVFWNVEEVKDQNALRLSYQSKDGEEGYPGNLNVTVMYQLTDDNSLKITYDASTDKATPVNLTNHSYFNLSADKNATILNHVLTLNAESMTVVDKDLTPTGEIRSVLNTEMDFTAPKKIGKDIKKVKEGGGYDHNYVLKNWDNTLKKAATVHDPASGRVMEVFTTEPGIQFYAGNFLDGSLVGKNGDKYQKNDGLCLETQHFPDSPNHSNFPSTILTPGKKYQSTTVYKFSVK
jgi:aldose 1-epimerase